MDQIINYFIITQDILNKMNATQPTGVSYDRRTNKFYATYTVNEEEVYIGSYNDAEDATKAYEDKLNNNGKNN